ncbi:hypothetical protein [Pelagibacterium halotolerans]|uniref:hypothetical protein n=1 Tax=Pelagibacterium halotolerans TaxID=531813 RepID=UPI00384DCCDC
MLTIDPSYESRSGGLVVIPAGSIRLGRENAKGVFLPEALWREFLGLDLDASALRQDHYGYHVRQNILDRPGEALQGAFSYFLGQNGQTLYLMPERNLVVYRAGEGLQLLHSTLYEVWKETH